MRATSPAPSRSRAAASKAIDVHVALLRGINVGGRNPVPMKALVELFTAAGCRAVETYIQSGNVVYRADASLAARLPGVIERAILERFGHRVPVVTRTADELRDVAGANPFPLGDVDLSRFHVAFLPDAPAAARAATLDPDRSPPDAFVLRGREIYFYFPVRGAKTRLTIDYFDSKLATRSTWRNWRTVLTLRDMTRR